MSFHPQNWAQILEAQAETGADRLAYRFLSDDGHNERSLTCREVRDRSLTAARALHQAGSARKPVLILCPPGIEFIIGLFGAICSGSAAVPASPPPRKRRQSDRATGIIRDAHPPIVLTTHSLLDETEQFLRENDHRARIFCVEEICSGSSSAPPADSAPNDLACIQYTSGSTADPRGVELTHANLLHNNAAIAQAFQHTRDSRGMIWLPPYHDMGLIGGILQPAYAGFAVTLISPRAFVANPLRWLREISKFGATTSGGPNFAYALAAGAIERASSTELEGLDLSSWQVAFNGAEPIDPAVLERFCRACEPMGFRREAIYPCYGLAETTLLASGGAKGAGAKIISIDGAARVSCGGAADGHEIAILDPQSGAPCADGQIGEICLAGPSIARGYHNRPDQTRAMFKSRRTASGAPMLRTGDLGAIYAGALVIAGRLKELIISRGVNHYPQDLERTVQQSHPALREHAGAAVSISEAGGAESLAIIQELRRESRHVEPAPIFDAIQQALSMEHGISASRIALLSPGALPITPSGKIRRRAALEMLQNGEIEPLAQWISPRECSSSIHAHSASDWSACEGLRRWLIDRLARQLALAPAQIDPAEPVARYGLDSVGAVGIACEISSNTGVELDAMAFWNYPTIDELAAHLESRGARTPAIAPAPMTVHS